MTPVDLSYTAKLMFTVWTMWLAPTARFSSGGERSGLLASAGMPSKLFVVELGTATVAELCVAWSATGVVDPCRVRRKNLFRARPGGVVGFPGRSRAGRETPTRFTSYTWRFN